MSNQQSVSGDQEGRLVSQRFCAADADVSFQSSDGVIFQVHKINLKICTGGFPPPEFETGNEIVQLTETSTTLELLFQFCYPERQPNLEALDFDILGSLAEAAEKYEVFSVMSICKILMRNSISQHTDDVLVYAARHNHLDILDIAAPILVLQSSLHEVLPKLPLNLVRPWALYCERWNQVLKEAIAYYDTWTKEKEGSRIFLTTNGYDHWCSWCRKSTTERYITHLLQRLGSGVECLKDLDTTFGPDICCASMKSHFVAWRALVETNIKGIPPFSTFL